jgi:hypothetical protein
MPCRKIMYPIDPHTTIAANSVLVTLAFLALERIGNSMYLYVRKARISAVTTIPNVIAGVMTWCDPMVRAITNIGICQRYKG